MILDILIALAAVAAYVLLVLVKPQTTCPACLGKRVRRHGGSRKKRRCVTCKGKGVLRPPFATAIHQAFWSVAGDDLLDRKRREAADRLDARKDHTP